MLVRPEATGTAETGLDLVGDEEGPVASAELRDGVPVLLRRDVDALALDRFDDEGRDVARTQLALEGVGVPERHRAEAGDQRPETLAELGPAVQRQRAEREAVEGVVAVRAPGTDPWRTGRT